MVNRRLFKLVGKNKENMKIIRTSTILSKLLEPPRLASHCVSQKEKQGVRRRRSVFFKTLLLQSPESLYRAEVTPESLSINILNVPNSSLTVY